MALVPCRECGTEVSDAALKCPHCGVQLRKAKRGFMGKIFKWTFILFNVFMAFWLISGMMGVSGLDAPTSDAEQAGAAIGATLGFGLILGIWVVGDIILGLLVLFTRPKT